MPSASGFDSKKKPLRYAPLRSPKEAETHYRASRAKILRSLAHASHRNGSHFALLWVSASGDHTDVYASEALQGKLGEWMGKDVQDEAKAAVRRINIEREQRARRGLEAQETDRVFGSHGEVIDLEEQGDEVVSADDDGDDSGSDEQQQGVSMADVQPMHARPPSAANYDEGLPTPTPTRAEGAKPPPSSSTAPSPVPPHASIPSTSRVTRSLASSTTFTTSHPSPAPSASSVPSPALTSATLSSVSTSPCVSVTFTPRQLTQWYTERFSDLCHKTDKTLCKVWIKVVEPAKQTRYPYQKGEETRPGWWPEGVRHKEPDHLGKTERIALLLHILHLKSTSIEELEYGTATVSMNAPLEKIAILNEIYRVAKEERKAKAASLNGTFDQITLLLPTSFHPKEDGGPSPPLPAPSEPRSIRQSRVRSRASVGGSPSAADNAQQTPRSVRASPYPLVRSHSVSTDLPSLAGDNSPRLAQSLASTPLSRSQSHAGPMPSSTGRARRTSGRSSIGEADFLDAKEALQATPYNSARARAMVTPRQNGSQGGSPLSASMGRSHSTSAIGAKMMMEDSVASPAMIKSRSRLSQQCFDQLGPLSGMGRIPEGAHSRPGLAAPAQFHVEHGLQHQHVQFQSVQPHHQRPSMQRGHSSSHPPQPHPQSRPHPPPQGHLAHPPHHRPMSRQPSGHSHPHQLHHHPHAQVQVQVQVHAGRDLPHVDNSSPYLAAYPTPTYAASPLTAHGAHFSPAPAHQHHPHQHQHLQFAAGTYELASTLQPHQLAAHEAYLVAQQQAGTPALSAAGGGGGGYVDSPHLSQHSQHDFLLSSAAASEHGGGGYERSPHDDGTYFLSPANPQASSGGGEADLGAYVQQLEAYEQQQAQAQYGYSDAGTPSMGLGLGFDGNRDGGGGGGGGGLGGMGADAFLSNDGYYDGFSQDSGSLSSMDPVQARRDEVRRRYEEHAFGIAGQA
ncbi:hypothetical protein JCM1840_000366 [Sporobolomyces johnsonii]